MIIGLAQKSHDVGFSVPGARTVLNRACARERDVPKS